MEASITATPVRAARHSRATAACMSSPFLGKYHGRIQLPTGSSSALRAAWLAWMAVVRTGSKVSPSIVPASAPSDTGV